MDIYRGIFEILEKTMLKQEAIIKSLTEKLEHLEIGKGKGGGGGGSTSATIEDYVSGKKYVRNTLIVDTDTETVYRVLSEYISDTVEKDCTNGYLKLVGFESQVITLGHEPTQKEIDSLPDNALVAIYSTTDTPYKPEESGYDDSH